MLLKVGRADLLGDIFLHHLAVALEGAGAGDGEILEQFRAHRVDGRLFGITHHSADRGAGIQDAPHHGFRLRVEIAQIDDGAVAGQTRVGVHGLDDSARILKPVWQQRVVDDAVEIVGAAGLHARHVRQRRADGVGAEQAGEEHQPVHCDGDGEREIGQAVAVLERVPGDDEAVRLVVAIELDEVDLLAEFVGVLGGKARIAHAAAGKAE